MTTSFDQNSIGKTGESTMKPAARRGSTIFVSNEAPTFMSPELRELPVKKGASTMGVTSPSKAINFFKTIDFQ